MKRTLLMTTATVALIAGMSAASAQVGGSGSGDQPRMQNAPAGSGATIPKGEEKVKPRIHENEPGAAVQHDQKDKTKMSQGQGQGMQDKQGQVEPRGDNHEKMGRDEKPGRDHIQGQMDQKEPNKAAQGSQAQGSPKSVQLSTEQRGKIRTTLINTKVERVTNVNFSIKVGARVPRTVRFYPLPVEIVEIVPEYRGYEYVLVGDEILIIDPDTFEIVAVLPA